MNKQELIAIVAEENELSKAQAGRIVDSVFEARYVQGHEARCSRRSQSFHGRNDQDPGHRVAEVHCWRRFQGRCCF